MAQVASWKIAEDAVSDETQGNLADIQSDAMRLTGLTEGLLDKKDEWLLENTEMFTTSSVRSGKMPW